jgi:hypothetical protein
MKPRAQKQGIKNIATAAKGRFFTAIPGWRR